MDVKRVNDGYVAPLPPTPGSEGYIPESVTPPVTSARESGSERKEPNVLNRAVDSINSSIEVHGRHLGIRYHEPSKRRVVTVYDSETNEVIREIPSEKVLDAYANMLEMLGIFVDTRG